jgi:hypothetical protein
MQLTDNSQLREAEHCEKPVAFIILALLLHF